ncbi:MAG TPA: ectoine/hydroxyectoine ABC transporter ATP-binding protein EhuA [Thermoanaerobaculia bacterium]|nr:ectoine/hydroxyectoine ABC transporter ATP-binding protein EhuA [Thermoanaerobaculia bacterium]
MPEPDRDVEPAPAIELLDAHKRFGDATVLDGLDVTVPKGQRLALIGPSGSGKSTVLRVIMGLEQLDRGALRIDGEEVPMPPDGGRLARAERERERRLRRRLGMVFQHFHLFPHMTVLRNLTEAPRVVLGLARDEAEQRARELLDLVGLADKEDAWPAQLSGGQKQRVAIARALALRPSILLFDEVTSALDPEVVGDVLDVLRRLAAGGEATMILVTHQMQFAEEVAQRVAFLDRGRILEEGPPAKLLRDPDQDRTRTFLKRVLEAR